MRQQNRPSRGQVQRPSRNWNCHCRIQMIVQLFRQTNALFSKQNRIIFTKFKIEIIIAKPNSRPDNPPRMPPSKLLKRIEKIQFTILKIVHSRPLQLLIIPNKPERPYKSQLLAKTYT